ncbi:MAG: hypothetical protein M3P45_13445 [Acidobacteriota bacterium]|nr:hypothetical protein [Acidobacteriota bacterium]
MARYSAFLGLQVEVQYRAGDILLPASGTFVGDTGRSVFLEQNFEQRGQRRNFRWEIPYQYIVRLAEKNAALVTSAAQEPSSAREPATAETDQASSSREESDGTEAAKDVLEAEQPESAHAAAAGYTSKASVIYPRQLTSNS